MKLPNKITNYSESVISKFPSLLGELSAGDLSLLALYNKTRKKFVSIEDFIDALDCLFAMKKVVFLADSEVIHYVA